MYKVFQSLIRGGQSNKNDFVMIAQVLKNAILISIASMLIIIGVRVYQQVPQFSYYQVYQKYKAYIVQMNGFISNTTPITMIYTSPTRERKRVYAKQLVNSRYIKQIENQILVIIKKSLYFGFQCSLLISGLVMLMWFLIGISAIRKKTLSGRTMAKPWFLKLKLQFTGKAPICD